MYDFLALDYRTLVQRWLAAAPPHGGLLFCHPGEATTDSHDLHDPRDPHDPIAAARVRELAYLSGPDFEADLHTAGVARAF